jgi:4-hydroxy-tetrahydrodipicolinate synthase
MKIMGYKAGIPRLPLTPGTEEEIAEVRRVMKESKVI